MGAMNGDIPLETIKSLTRKYLSTLNDLDIEVYDFDPNYHATFITLWNIGTACTVM